MDIMGGGGVFVVVLWVDGGGVGLCCMIVYGSISGFE